MNSDVIDATRLWTLAVPTVGAFITSLVRDFQDRDDVLQQTAVAVLESFARYDRSQSFNGWAIGVARNQVRLYYRKQGRDQLVFDSDVVEALARTFSDRPAHDPRFDHLGTCVSALDTRAQEICRLRYGQDLKPAQIAAQLGTAANTVAKALQRIRERLKACIERKMLEACP